MSSQDIYSGGYPENDYRYFLEHSSKGTHWKKGHKYIAIVNGRYIYPAKKAVGRLVQKVKNKRNLEKARDDINQRVFSKYDNYAALGKTPEGNFTFRSKDGKSKMWTESPEAYKNGRDYLMKEYGRKKTKEWKPFKKSNKEG